MKGGEVIRKARKLAGLTQADLAHRLGATSSVVSRWESGRVEPRFATVLRAVESVGLQLADVLNEREPDPHDVSLLETTLAMTVDERLQRVIDYARFVGAGREVMRAR